MECTTAAARGTEGSTESTSIRITGGVCLVVVVVVVVVVVFTAIGGSSRCNACAR
tara:strand:+ start:306 stop:470 length:165 start_codon:yes stop_codon:yes gene_type:complete